MSDTFLTLAQAAERLQCHPETLRRAIGKGVLKAGRLGEKEYRIAEEDLMEYIYRKEQVAEVK